MSNGKFLQKIFLIENNGSHKIIKIFNFIKIKFKHKCKNILTHKELELKKVFLEHSVKKYSILMVETNSCHGECLVGMAKYFCDMGYNVDILLSEKEYNLTPFSLFHNPNIRIFITTLYTAREILKSSVIRRYSYIYINSDRVYDNRNNKEVYFSQFYKRFACNREKILVTTHSPGMYNPEIFKKFKYIMLSDIPVNSKYKPLVVNPHYYGEVNFTSKNQITTFICIGNIESKRKNHNLLLDTIRILTNQGITNFKVNVIARYGKLENIDEDIRPYLDFKGSLSYEDMYKEMENADFFLTLLDPDNPEHERYLTIGTSGSFQLIYGFLKPCLIAGKFSDKYGFTNDNSIIYEKNEDLVNAMETAINMTQKAYRLKQDSLKKLSDEIKAESISNLEKVVNREVCCVK